MGRMPAIPTWARVQFLIARSPIEGASSTSDSTISFKLGDPRSIAVHLVPSETAVLTMREPERVTDFPSGHWPALICFHTTRRGGM
ncbi:hypothetical protein HEB94_002393 [Actinopolymorpha pittospori]|uniref:Uncharacterized protein n=1 Tax=Actinopolymorpha pittospori TaxID=648752 RepID=A0A927MYK4_9ACTN|nr:hypothetical protein [Actinopolymorpha pittospori]